MNSIIPPNIRILHIAWDITSEEIWYAYHNEDNAMLTTPAVKLTGSMKSELSDMTYDTDKYYTSVSPDGIVFIKSINYKY